MAKKSFFEPCDVNVNFPELEKRLLKSWYKSGIVDKYLRKNKNSSKRFSFLDGPITANNPMGVHHAWGRTYKDLWQRYKNMQGFRQRFQNGFDCQGLWVEVEVEKELGLKSKKDIENLVQGDKKASIAKFVQLCKERVYRYAKIQTEQSKRLGYFMDWDNSYFTLSDENNYMIWHFLKNCYQRDLIYKGRDSVPWCPRCGTAISQHEILTEDYKEATHDSLYIEYPISAKKNEFLLVWTTTPWTLPGNVAVAVDPNAIYVQAVGSIKGNKYYLNETSAEKLGLKIERRFKGGELVGLIYESPFDGLDRVQKSLGTYLHRVFATDEKILPISLEEGTGLVHIAPGAGTEDFQLGKKLNLPVIELIDEEANYLDGLGDFSFKNAKDKPEIILEYLKNFQNGRYLFDIVAYKHRYPACWRCKTELVWRVVDEWYIAMDPLRDLLKSVSKKINWIPEFGLKRELDWLENMHDWLISKKRFWGLALPIWECDNCGDFEVIGSKEELKQRAVEGWDKFEGNSPHRPWVDGVKISCQKCGEVKKRVPDVGNPWLDAGIVSFSTITTENKGKPLYLIDKKEFYKWYPADFITESFPGQFKNWFYSLIAMSAVLEKKEPTRNILGFATLLGEDGRPMHKSWGNSIEFNEGAEKIGVDVMRWMYSRQNPSDDLLFGYKVADEVRRKFHLKIWNIYNFFVTYAIVNSWKPKKKLRFSFTNKRISLLDRWILLRFDQVLSEVTEFLDRYDAYSASLKIEEFVDDLSNWYIRRSRERVSVYNDPKDRDSFFETTYNVLVNLAKILAPFTPFLSEVIYKNLTKKESVHLESWPKPKFLKDQNLISQMKLIREIAEKVHSQRKLNNIPVRQPLFKTIVRSPYPKPKNDIINLLKEEVNVKEVYWSSGKQLQIRLDTKITPELKEEMQTRLLIRKIQEERKKMGISLTSKIIVYNNWYPKDKKLYRRIIEKTVAKKLEMGDFRVIKAR